MENLDNFEEVKIQSMTNLDKGTQQFADRQGIASLYSHSEQQTKHSKIAIMK
jgi:hypothetical protein